MTNISKDKIANNFLSELLNLTRHISNVSNEDTNIGSGIFILSIIDSLQNCIMKDIIESLNLLASTATRQVDMLAKQDLIKRDVAETDRRKVILSLTEKGKQLNKRFKNHLIKVITSSMETHSKEDIILAIEVLHTIIEYSEKNLPLV
ncbi:MAG: MarR family winged helix-turn-helix transcriptional regulator [Promethearchaeota archaeon]|jgi:DNA-binding MarR family transcriptional regulator